MNEKLILLEDVDDLGKAGDTVSVALGFARNFLLPRKMALRASKGATRQLQARMEKIQEQRQQRLEQANVLKEKIAGTEVTIPMNAGEDDKLYGSVTSHAIADALKNAGVEVDPHKIHLDKPIKELGSFEVSVKLHPDISATLKVWIVRA